MRRWWTAEDTFALEALAEPLVDQFSGYQPLPSANVDGKLTRTENMADLGGLTAAFDAYRLSLGKKSTTGSMFGSTTASSSSRSRRAFAQR